MKRKQHSPSPKRLTAIQTSRHFGVAAHRHTGRVLPRNSTSYPVLAMIVLVVGVLIGGWTHTVGADTPVGSPQISDSYTVKTSVPGPAPTQAATVSTPTDGTHVTDKPIVVKGSCPPDAGGGYVSIYRNGFFSGTALCDGAGAYQLSIDLFVGANQLIARIYNFTDAAGPDSNPITVYYDPPAAPTIPIDSGTSTKPNQPTKQGFSSNAASTTPAPSTSLPLSLSTDFKIRGYYVGQQTMWQLDLAGGSGPYAIAIDWGDGSSGIASRADPGQVRLTHTYDKAGAERGSYIVKFTATDADGNQTFLQLLVIVNSQQVSPIGIASPTDGGSLTSGLLGFVSRYIWPSYGIVVLMLASFWLGERREYRLLRHRPKRVRHA
ncbi:MAG: hypothetical protein ABIV43_02545 [Candidatus Saccharimonadales bacterium]